MMKHIETFESFLNEAEVNLNDKFALVSVGGSIGQIRRNMYPVFAKGQSGNVIETGNDKEELKEKAKQMRSRLSSGERSYYRMNYTVIELTPRKVQEINYLKDYQAKSEKEKDIE